MIHPIRPRPSMNQTMPLTPRRLPKTPAPQATWLRWNFQTRPVGQPGSCPLPAWPFQPRVFGRSCRLIDGHRRTQWTTLIRLLRRFGLRPASRRFPNQSPRFLCDLRTIGFFLRLKDGFRCCDGREVFCAATPMAIGLHERMSGSPNSLGRVQRSNIDRTGNKSPESEHQHECRSRDFPTTMESVRRCIVIFM